VTETTSHTNIAPCEHTRAVIHHYGWGPYRIWRCPDCHGRAQIPVGRGYDPVAAGIKIETMDIETSRHEEQE
jgi:hypothetical protein